MKYGYLKIKDDKEIVIRSFQLAGVIVDEEGQQPMEIEEVASMLGRMKIEAPRIEVSDGIPLEDEDFDIDEHENKFIAEEDPPEDNINECDNDSSCSNLFKDY